MPALKLPIALLIASAGAVFGQCTNPTCSVVIPNAFTSASIAAGTIGSFRIEARLVGMNWLASTGSNEDVFNIGGFGVTYLGGSGQTNFIQFKSGDNTPGNIPCYVNLGGANPSDVSVRITRNLGTSTSTLEAFSTPTGALLGANCVFTIVTTYPSASIIAAGSYFGNPVASVLGGAIAFIRWYSTLVPIGTAVPVAVVTPADLADYEFDNNLTDTSGRSGQNFAGTVTYANTPIYNPSCSAGTQQSVSGTTMSLSGANSLPLNGGTTLTYVWSYFTGSDGVNQSPTITGSTTVNPTVTGLNLFGSADFHLVVTDSTANTSSCDIHNGVVKITGAAGVIDLTAEGVPATSQLIIGPLIKFGSNRWPWADTIHMQEADLQGKNMGIFYTAYWETPEAGTISLSAGSNVITGTGTNLQLPCGGGTSPLQDAAIHIIYPGTDGLTHYANGVNIACTDATHMTFEFLKSGGGGYPTGTPSGVYPNCTVACTGWHWSWGTTATGHGVNSQYGNWINNGRPGNYYDNAKMFYGLYLRSGIDTYQQYFHNMADWWWEFPVMDQGYACDPAGSSCWAPAAYRTMSMNGIYLRALEQGGGSTKWPGIWIVSQLAQSTLVNYATFTFPVSIDGRETGYMMSILSYCALTDPNSGHRATCKANIQTNLSAVWTHFRRTDIGSASWLGLQYANQIPANEAISFTNNGAGGQGSACVVNGSSTVTGTGTVWSGSGPTNMTGFSIWFYTGTGPANAPADNTVGDPVGYGIVSVNSGAQIMTLTSAYAGTSGCTGTSGSNKGYLVGYFQGDIAVPTPSNGFIGWGILPYSQGILGTSFGWAAKAMDDGAFDPAAAILYRQYMHETVTWLQNYALNPISGGLYSGTLFVGCIPPISSSNVGCFSGDISGARTLSLDVMRDLSMDYLQNGQPSATFTTADLLMSQMFSKPGTGGPNPDGNYINQYDGFYTDPSILPPVGQQPIWAGQLCGFEEACDMWPAARLFFNINGGVTGTGIRRIGVISR